MINGNNHRGPRELRKAVMVPRPSEEAELRAYSHGLSVRLNQHIAKHHDFQQVYKAVAHALLFRAQFAGVPTEELVGFLRTRIHHHLGPGGSKLGMSPELKQRLETGAGMPVWPNEQDRAKINRALKLIYAETDKCPVYVQIRIYWHLLMQHAESLGMTHESILLRLEVLDRLQRAEGRPERYIPDEPPAWYRHQQEAKR